MIGALARLRFSGLRSLPLVCQAEATECGMACIAMIASYYGCNTGIGPLRRRFGASVHGANLQQLMSLARQLELAPRPLKLDLKNLRNLQLPCILHWNMNHFVVLKKTSRGAVVIHDPAIGRRKLTIEEVSRHFTGIALELNPTAGFKPQNSTEKLRLRQLWSRSAGIKSSLAKILALSLVVQVCTLGMPYYLQLTVDDVLLSGDMDLLLVLFFGFAIVLVIDVAARALRSFLLLHFNAKFNLQVASNLFAHLVRLPVSFFVRRHIGDVVTRFGSLNAVRDFFTGGLIESVVDGLMALLTLCIIFFYSPMLAVIVVVATLAYGLLRVGFYQPYRQANEAAILASAKEQSHFIETVRGITTLRLHGAEGWRQHQWLNRHADVLNAGTRIGLLDLGYKAFHGLVFGIEHLFIILLGAKAVMAGGFSVGMLMAFISFKQQFETSALGLVEKMLQFRLLGLHLDRIADIALERPDPLVGEQAGLQGPMYGAKGRIEVRNASYQFSASSPVILDRISLVIEPGESVAIVGASGSGKTTLLKLMLGLYQPTRGEILVDGLPLGKGDSTSYRNRIGCVMQDDELFSGSLAENIAFFSDDYDLELIARCASAAAIHEEIIALPMGYNTPIGDMGSSLSGGQKQRILLARALYRRPRILFLDEATSHLDVKNEAKINAAIRRLRITRVVVAHRPETILSADRVLAISSDGCRDVTEEIGRQGCIPVAT
ncbi:peptidase domain-containing ABC transporter [Biformimicrobium ophioploci]|uniref:Peptidase domain-containing ABC transporter n=1 Tax=Biformimicrobium ophioploci TaxID=3036711 RepID=A0ABQ6LUH5_9GAMM|nr:peptidase domain-containing ABC transporter [Microbulbifer sp. NKW57]GMG85692.1 peptidase domain-containing ABC transporter [Microbulbifer sp. NKW57]